MTAFEPNPEMPDLHDAELIAALVRNRQIFLNFLARHIGNRADAEDVLQTFSMNVLTRSDGLRADSETGSLAWLSAVLRSTLTNYFRKNQRVKRIENTFAMELATAPDGPGSDELHSVFCECLRMLLPLLKADQADLLLTVCFSCPEHGWDDCACHPGKIENLAWIGAT